MEPFILKSKEYFSIQSWTDENARLVAGFSTKVGGTSQLGVKGLNFGFHVGDDYQAVCKNREILAGKLGFSLDRWVGAEQTHEVSIQKVTKRDIGKGAKFYETSFPRTDGFITNDSGVLLTLCYADCVPLFFWDKESGLIGLAHAGWKGSVDGIAKEILSQFVQNGGKLKTTYAVIGPSICKKCYIVDNRVINLVEKVLEGVEEKPYNQINKGQYSLDLKKLNQQVLISAGLDESNITQTDYCTSCDSDYFYSHRRDNGATGRMMAFIGWKEGSLLENESKG
jgi:polyphenol oxidase